MQFAGVREPFLLTFSVLWILLALLPKTLYCRDGKPIENQTFIRIALISIGLALLIPLVLSSLEIVLSS
jgi:hypothetical protein